MSREDEIQRLAESIGLDVKKLIPKVYTDAGIVVHIDAVGNIRTLAKTISLDFEWDGDYIMRLSFNYNSDSTTSDGVYYANLDGNAIDSNDRDADAQGQFQILRVEPKDVAVSSGGNITGTASGQKYAYNMPFVLTGQTSGTKDLIIEMTNEGASAETSIWNVTVELQHIF